MNINYPQLHQLTEVFWAEINPCPQLIQMYDCDGTFLSELGKILNAGIKRNDATVIIATSTHLKALEERLAAKRINLGAIKKSNLFITYNANEKLAELMPNGVPDVKEFKKFTQETITNSKDRPIRIFSEMVALLWAQGFKNRAAKLEEILYDLCNAEEFKLFCPFPHKEERQEPRTAIINICRQHPEFMEIMNKMEDEAGINFSN